MAAAIKPFLYTTKLRRLRESIQDYFTSPLMSNSVTIAMDEEVQIVQPFAGVPTGPAADNDCMLIFGQKLTQAETDYNAGMAASRSAAVAKVLTAELHQ